jgi:dihydroxyacid dehydratase/phosphogluconate dehydratase
VLHLLAIAREAGVALVLDDFTAIGERVPRLADVKPFGNYVTSTVDEVGGVPVVMKALLDAGLLHGDVLTVTGRTVAENLAEVEPLDPDGKVLRALDGPIHPSGGITILAAPWLRVAPWLRAPGSTPRGSRASLGSSMASRARWSPWRTARCGRATSW